MIQRSVVHLLSAVLLLGPAGAATQEGVGSASEDVTINAEIGNACVLSAPTGPITATPVLYWTSANTAASGGTVNVQCNVGTVFSLDSSAPSELFLNGVAGGPSLPLDFSGGTTEGETTAEEAFPNTVATPAGQDYPFSFTAGPAGQEDPAGTYSGAVTITLTVYGASFEPPLGECPPGWDWTPVDGCIEPELE